MLTSSGQFGTYRATFPIILLLAAEDFIKPENPNKIFSDD